MPKIFPLLLYTSSEMLSFLHRWDIVESVNLIKMSKLLSPCWRTIRFLWKKYISKHGAGCSGNLYIARNCTKENAKCHIQHEEKWLRWIVIEQVNYYFLLIFFERNCARTLSKPLRKKYTCVFWENEGKMHKGGCVKVFFFNLQVGTSQFH